MVSGRAMVVCRVGLLLAATLTAPPGSGADERPEPAVVTVKSGDMAVQLQRSHGWSIQRILCGGVEVGGPTGAWGAVVCIPAAGGWVGSAHTQGGVEQVEAVALTVDGEPVAMTDGAVYTGERAQFRKRAMLDRVQLEATLTLEGGVLTERHVLTATEDVVVTVIYPFMHCVTAETAEWMAVTTGGEEVSGEFTGSTDLDWHEDWDWTAAFIPDSRTGFLLRHLSRPEGATTLTGYWDQERYHKLYVKVEMQEEPWREGGALQSEVAVTCFRAAPADWREVARRTAAGLVAE